MNNKWHTKNQVEIEREYKTNSSNVEEEDKRKKNKEALSYLSDYV